MNGIRFHHLTEVRGTLVLKVEDGGPRYYWIPGTETTGRSAWMDVEWGLPMPGYTGYAKPQDGELFLSALSFHGSSYAGHKPVEVSEDEMKDAQPLYYMPEVGHRTPVPGPMGDWPKDEVNGL